MTRQLRIAILSGLFLLSSLAMVHSVRAQNPPPKKPVQPTSDQMTNIPYYTLRDGMSSTLTLNNLAPAPTKVTVTIFNIGGQAHVLDPITLDTHSVKEVQLANVAPQGFDSGNIEVAFNGIPMAVTCQVSVFSVTERVSFESREQDMMDFESATLAGILSLPKGADGFLAVTNVAKNRVTFQLTAGSLKKTAALFPRETQLIKLNEDEHLSATTLVKLQHNGLPGDLITTGYVLNLKDGYSSGFAMFDPGIMRSSTLAGAHFRAGQPDPSEGFPEGTRFHSPLLLANLSASPVVAHVSVDYTVEDNQGSQGNGDDAQKNSTSTVKDTVVKVKDLTIAPGDVQRVELSDALGGVGQIAEAGVDIAYNAAPGSVIGQLTSVDQSGDYAFEVPIKDRDAMNETMESIYPWTLENGTATVLHLKNTTNETQEAGVLISFAGGTYNPDKFELQPYQTIALDIQKLKDTKKPDVLGHLFPSGATHGQLVWFQKTPYTMIGRAEGTDVAAGIARSFSCAAACCDYFWNDFFLTPSVMNGLAGDGGTFIGTSEGSDCSGYYFQYLNVAASSWTTSNSAVATVNSSGYTYCAGPGSATIIGNFPTRNYYWNDTFTRCLWTYPTFPAPAPVNVNPPNHVRVVSDLQGYTSCPANYTPVDVRSMNMQLVDQNSIAVVTNYSNYEKPFINMTTNTCGNGQPTPAICFSTGPTKFCTTCGTGQFNDTMAVTTSNSQGQFCSTVNPTILAGNCGFSLTSTWAMCSNGLTNNVWTSTRGTYSKSVIVNGNSSTIPPGTIYY